LGVVFSEERGELKLRGIDPSSGPGGKSPQICKGGGAHQNRRYKANILSFARQQTGQLKWSYIRVKTIFMQEGRKNGGVG